MKFPLASFRTAPHPAELGTPRGPARPVPRMSWGAWLSAFVVAVSGLGSMPLAHAAYDIGQLMSDLATQQGGRVRFVEKRHVALLDKPVQVSGEMVFSPPHRLEKRTLLPRPEILVLDQDTLSVERDKRKFTIHLASRPEALAFVGSIRSTLLGNRRALEQDYALALEGERQRWVLTLVPNDPAIAGLLKRITVSGSKNQVRHIEYLQTDGDRSEISIEPIEVP